MTKSLPSVTIVRRIKAPPAKVWAAITQPELMMQWWGPDAGPTLSAEADVRPGGRFSVVFRLLNGEEHNPTGIYQEVVPEKKLVFTWEWPGMPERESLVTFLLEPFDGGTELTLIHEHLPDEEARKSHEARLEWPARQATRFPWRLPNERPDPHHLRLGSRNAARLCARHPGALGAGRGRLALSRREHAVSRSEGRAFRAPALRPGAVADRWRHLDLRERRDPAASRRAERRADARRSARPQRGQGMAVRGAQFRRDGEPALVPVRCSPGTADDTPAWKLFDGFLKVTGSSTWSRCWRDANGWPGPSPSPTSSWRTCCASSIGSTGWRTIPPVATTSRAPRPARPS